MALLFDVLFDDFVGDVAATHTEVAARPQMSAPELLLQMRELAHHLVGRLPLQQLHESADRDARRHTQEQMNMILRHVPFDDRDFEATAYLADQFSESQPDFTAHHGFTILRDPHDVQVDAEDRVRAVPVLCHPANLPRGRKPAKAFA